MISENPGIERRNNQRSENNIPVKICQKDGDIVTETMNVSRSGAYCCVDRNLPLMTRLKIHLLLSQRDAGKSAARKISCEGVVVRSEPAADENNYNIAIFFSDITRRDAECLMDYINGALAQDEVA